MAKTLSLLGQFSHLFPEKKRAVAYEKGEEYCRVRASQVPTPHRASVARLLASVLLGVPRLRSCTRRRLHGGACLATTSPLRCRVRLRRLASGERADRCHTHHRFTA